MVILYLNGSIEWDFPDTVRQYSPDTVSVLILLYISCTVHVHVHVSYCESTECVCFTMEYRPFFLNIVVCGKSN